MGSGRVAFESGEDNSPSPSGAKGEEVAGLNFVEDLLNRKGAVGSLQHLKSGFFDGHVRIYRDFGFLARPRVRPT